MALESTGGRSELAYVGLLDLVEPERSTERCEHLVGDVALPALLKPA